ncbi:MAG: ogr/Delta-like zinc finger family protein [Methylobacter sp.]
MRVVCPHCSKKAIITSSNAMSETVKDLYCQCTNTKDCGASFVFVLAYKHDLNPPVKTTLQIAASLINNLKPDQRKQLQADLFG